jgi:hypothetical protein
VTWKGNGRGLLVCRRKKRGQGVDLLSALGLQENLHSFKGCCRL